MKRAFAWARTIAVLSLLHLTSVAYAADLPKSVTNSIGMQFVLIPSGTYIMGSPDDEEGRDDDETRREVTFSRAYWMGIYEVTQAEYIQVIGTNPSHFQTLPDSDCRRHPVERVKWQDAQQFCAKLSLFPAELAAGRTYRLPTEAEWECASRARGTKDDVGPSEIVPMEERAWFVANSLKRTHPVGEKKPNRWGIYDTNGNVWEWCQDWYEGYPAGPLVDPQGPRSSSARVYRGGSWYDEARFCRSSYRGAFDPSDRYYFLGFRVALVLAENPTESPE